MTFSLTRRTLLVAGVDSISEVPAPTTTCTTAPASMDLS